MQQPLARNLTLVEHDRVHPSVVIYRDSAAHVFPTNTVGAREVLSKESVAV